MHCIIDGLMVGFHFISSLVGNYITTVITLNVDVTDL